MFTTRQNLLLGGSVLVAVLLVAGSYFGSRWLHGPDVEPVPEHLLSDKPRSVSINRPIHAAVFQDTLSVSEADLVSEDESFSDVGLSANSDEIDDAELEAFLEELSALEQLEQDEGKSSDFPEVPDGFPSNLTPVWIKYPNYQKGDMHDHEMIYRVLIKLWNQGDRDFVNGVYKDAYGKVYPLYRDVVYVRWRTEFYTGPDGEKIEFPFISGGTATHARGDPEVNVVGAGLFKIEEMISGAYKTKYPGLKLVDYEDAGYNPETFLDDH